MSQQISRRSLLGAGLGLAAAAGIAPVASAAEQRGKRDRSAAQPFGFCLNMSTIRGQKLSVTQQIDVAAQAGYDAIEPWMGELDAYVKAGGSLKDLDKRIRDAGLTVESAIGFAEWIVDDEARRARGLEHAKRDMDTLRQIGGKRIAAPPIGATDQANLNLMQAAARYRALLEVGAQLEVVPQVEVWGFSKSLSRLGETTLVAIESGHPQACLLPDVYHIYKGGSDFAGLELLSGDAFDVFHINDYPATPGREAIKDADRVYPGDGVAPLNAILQTMHANGFRGFLSLELFNPGYWQQDALQVARTGLEKMQAAVQKALT